MKITGVFLMLAISFSSPGADTNKKIFSIKTRSLKNVEPVHFIELIAKNDDRNTIGDIESFKLEKQKAGFIYEFFPYAGEGSNKRTGEIDLKGSVLKREIDYEYCSHSMGPENQCIVAKLVETLDDDKKKWEIKGLCKITKIKNNKVIQNIKIFNKKTLTLAKNHCEGGALKFLVPNTVDVKLLEPLIIK